MTKTSCTNECKLCSEFLNADCAWKLAKLLHLAGELISFLQAFGCFHEIHQSFNMAEAIIFTEAAIRGRILCQISGTPMVLETNMLQFHRNHWNHEKIVYFML